MNLTDEDQQVYIDDYQKRLQFKEDLRGSAAQSFLTQGLARFTDAINIVPETIVDTYRNIKYGDIGKAAGFSEPFDVRPDGEEFYGLGVDVGDPTFYEELNTPRNTTGPSIDDILGSRPEPPEPPQQEDKEEAEIIDEVIQGEEEEEERPGFVESAYGALKSFYDVGDTDLEKRASRAARGRRKYGTSYQQAYNDELLKLQLGEAKIAQYVAATEESQTNDIEEFVNTIRRYKPDLSEEAAVDIFLSTKNKTKSLTKLDFIKSVESNIKLIKEDVQSPGQHKTELENGTATPGISYDSWVVNRAQKITNATYGINQEASEESEFKIIGIS